MISLAKAGKAVTYVFLRGFTETDHVMSIATKIQTEKYANITARPGQVFQKSKSMVHISSI